MSSRKVLLVAVAMLATAACDSGPSGPGVLVGTVEGESLGGALLEVTGPGIVGFEGLDGTRVYDADVAGSVETHRVLMIHPAGGRMRFEIQVEDVGMEDPVMTVISAAGVNDLTLLTAGITARIER